MSDHAAASAAAAAAYNASFAPYATRDDDDVLDVGVSSFVRPTAFGAMHSASAQLTMFDESATDWIQRDSAHPQVPNAIRHMQGSVRLWSLLPCCDIEGETNGGVTPEIDPKIHAGHHRQTTQPNS